MLEVGKNIWWKLKTKSIFFKNNADDVTAQAACLGLAALSTTNSSFIFAVRGQNSGSNCNQVCQNTSIKIQGVKPKRKT